MITRFRLLGLALLLLLGLMLNTATLAAPATRTHQDSVLGVSVVYPAALQVVTDHYLFDAYGFTITEPTVHAKDGDSHAEAWLRVGWLHGVKPAALETRAKRLIDQFPGIAIQRANTTIAGQPAVVLSNVPGLGPTTYIYLTANGRLYELIYAQSALDAPGLALIETLRFQKAQRSLESLGLINADAALFRSPGGAQTEANKGSIPGTAMPDAAPIGPQAIAGCVDYPTSKYLQTPFTAAANGNGYSRAGPSYYGQGLHTGCNNAGSQNDYYALDMALRSGDPVLNPSNSGVVRWAGWASGGWASLGRTVIIDQGNGYLSLAAHLSGINVSVGQSVNANTVIGWAGGSGYGSDGYWGSHLHQGLYLSANMSSGGTYGGQSAQMIKVNYCRNGCANYYWYLTNQQQLSW